MINILFNLENKNYYINLYPVRIKHSPCSALIIGT